MTESMSEKLIEDLNIDKYFMDTHEQVTRPDRSYYLADEITKKGSIKRLFDALNIIAWARQRVFVIILWEEEREREERENLFINE